MCMKVLISGIGMKELLILLDFAKAFGLVVANSSFPKEKHLVNFHSTVGKTDPHRLLAH